MPKNFVRGYKTFDNYIKYSVGSVYTKKSPNAKGFTFCTTFSHIFDVDSKNPLQTKVAEIKAYGDVFAPTGINRFWRETTEIEIVKEITYAEIFEIENLSKMFSEYITKESKDDLQVTAEKLEALTEKIAHLPEKDRFVLCARFGIITGRPETFADIGNKFDISRERVRQLELRSVCNLMQGFNLKLRPTGIHPDLRRIHLKCN